MPSVSYAQNQVQNSFSSKSYWCLIICGSKEKDGGKGGIWWLYYSTKQFRTFNAKALTCPMEQADVIRFEATPNGS